MGAAASLATEDQRASLHIAVLQVLPSVVYALEERRFKAGSFYETPEFAQQKELRPLFAALGLHEWSISHLWRHFRQMNETGSGTVTLWEFREYFDLPDDRSTTRLFRCFDEDRDNRIGFLELVVGMWTYCCNCNASVVCLCFDLLDMDHNGKIGADEFDFMIVDVFGPEWEENDEAKAVHTCFHERDDALLGSPEMDMEAWSAFVSANLQIQAPAVHIRLVLQKKVLGVGFWTHCLRKSMTIFLGRTVTVEHILSAHVSPNVLEELAQDRRLELDHDDSTQFNLRVIRRTGPFPRRRKYRDLAGGKLRAKEAAAVGAVAADSVKKFATLTVREAFERVTVPAGQDATWEEPKPPSTLQALMASLTAIVERAPPGGAPAAGSSASPSLSRSPASRSPTSCKKRKNNKKGAPPDALALLKNRPGIDGAPLGSPAAAPSSPAGSAVDADPAIANAFYGLKPLPEAVAPVSPSAAAGSGRNRAKTAARTAKKGGSPAASSPGGSRAVGGGKTTLSRTGKELVGAGEVGCVGVPGGEGGMGALSARLFNGANGGRSG
ncbi:unnamed protein product [Ectocarpus sp. 4 AP-2014]